MTRRTPLKRKARMRQKRARPRRSGRVRDGDYLLRVKGLPCCLMGGFLIEQVSGRPTYYPCDGPVEADHAGSRPLGRKCSDDEAIPLCTRHHVQRTCYVGWFSWCKADTMRAWCDERIAETRARLGREVAA